MAFASWLAFGTATWLGFIGNIAHKPDLGGKVPGTNSGDATDLFQEGLLIPPLKILRRGEINTDVEALICANTRTPEVTWGDIKAQVNTNTYGLGKFAELFGKHGVDRVLACWHRWMDICEVELRKEIAKVPRAGLSTDGAFGFRVGKDLNLHISTLDVTHRLAPVPVKK